MPGLQQIVYAAFYCERLKIFNGYVKSPDTGAATPYGAATNCRKGTSTWCVTRRLDNPDGGAECSVKPYLNDARVSRLTACFTPAARHGYIETLPKHARALHNSCSPLALPRLKLPQRRTTSGPALAASSSRFSASICARLRSYRVCLALDHPHGPRGAARDLTAHYSDEGVSAARGAARRYRAMGSFAAPDQRLAQDTGAAVPARRRRCLGVARRLSHARCDNPFLAICCYRCRRGTLAIMQGGDMLLVPAAVLGHFSAPRCPVFRRCRAQRRRAAAPERVLLDGHDGAARPGNVRLYVRRAAEDEPGVDSGRHGDLLRAAYRLHHHTDRAMAAAVRPCCSNFSLTMSGRWNLSRRSSCSRRSRITATRLIGITLLVMLHIGFLLCIYIGIFGFAASRRSLRSRPVACGTGSAQRVRTAGTTRRSNLLRRAVRVLSQGLPDPSDIPAAARRHRSCPRRILPKYIARCRHITAGSSSITTARITSASTRSCWYSGGPCCFLGSGGFSPWRRCARSGSMSMRGLRGTGASWGAGRR